MSSPTCRRRRTTSRTAPPCRRVDGWRCRPTRRGGTGCGAGVRARRAGAHGWPAAAATRPAAHRESSRGRWAATTARGRRPARRAPAWTTSRHGSTPASTRARSAVAPPASGRDHGPTPDDRPGRTTRPACPARSRSTAPVRPPRHPEPARRWPPGSRGRCRRATPAAPGWCTCRPPGASSSSASGRQTPTSGRARPACADREPLGHRAASRRPSRPSRSRSSPR